MENVWLSSQKADEYRGFAYGFEKSEEKGRPHRAVPAVCKILYRVKILPDQREPLPFKGRGLFFLRLYSQQIIRCHIVEPG